MSAKIVRSPRAPSFSLEESLKHALSLYDANGKHLTPADVAAKALGYSGANNGSAARALASMKSFGVLNSNNKGDVSVSPDIEGYKYAPDEQHKHEMLIRWLRQPKIYAELLDEYHDSLPSDQALRYKLIKMGFLPAAAEECLKNFRASIDFAKYYERRSEEDGSVDGGEEMWGGEPASTAQALATQQAIQPLPPLLHPPVILPLPPAPTPAPAFAVDRIPVRLSGGRRAWIEVPTPLYESDKEILKRQIDLIFTDEETDPFA